MFVMSAEGEWVNLARAAALKVERDLNPNRKGGWVALAVFSGRSVVLGRFPTDRAARDWLADELEFAGLASKGD